MKKSSNNGVVAAGENIHGSPSSVEEAVDGFPSSNACCANLDES
jgi:uncharacterized protein YkwD